MRISAYLVSILAAAAILHSGGAHAQDYPARTVRIIVPFTAAGGADIMARSLAKRLTASMGQQFIVDNPPGANGIIGADIVARAAPDGYTLLLSTNGLTINPWLHLNIPFNVERDFAPIIKADLARWNPVFESSLEPHTRTESA